tara:strand:+ start:241 stop:411 length:171 start_codon:yes stop_codon:yes gene_type:complete
VVEDAHETARVRVVKLCDKGREDDAFSIVQEFREWYDDDNHEIYSLAYIGEDSEYF